MTLSSHDAHLPPEFIGYQHLLVKFTHRVIARIFAIEFLD